MDAMHALPSRQHVVVKYQSGCVVVVLLRLSSLPVDMRHHDSFLQKPGDWTMKQTNKQALPFLSKERQTSSNKQLQNFLHSSSFFLSFFLKDRLLTTNTWSCILLLALLLLLIPERQTCDKGTTTTTTTNPASSIFVSRRSRLPTRYNTTIPGFSLLLFFPFLTTRQTSAQV